MNITDFGYKNCEPKCPYHKSPSESMMYAFKISGAGRKYTIIKCLHCLRDFNTEGELISEPSLPDPVPREIDSSLIDALDTLWSNEQK